MTTLPSYIQLPSAAIPIPAPSVTTPAPKPPVVQSFPPSSSTASTTTPRKLLPTSSISTNVSDLLLGSLLPANLPKLAQGAKAAGGGPGKPRELSTQREVLSLPLMSNNFRRFVTKVGGWLSAGGADQIRSDRCSGYRIGSRRFSFGGNRNGRGRG
jgi:hypothetical protein